MKIIALTWRVFSIATAALLAGCGGSQPIGAPGIVPQTSVTTTRAKGGPSRILTNAKGEDLIYAADSAETVSNFGEVIVLTYPQGKVVGVLTGFDDPSGACVDSAGDVWISNRGGSLGSGLVEYAHGGTQPIATLSVDGNPQGCSVDPTTTGNLAAAVGNEVLIWPNAHGTPTQYSAQSETRLAYCGYDNRGNLFIDGQDRFGQFTFVELPKGGKKLRIDQLPKSLGYPGQVQWDGKYITAAARRGYKPAAIYRLEVSGSSGRIVQRINFGGADIDNGQSWIQGGMVIEPVRPKGSIDASELGLWNYPAGGKVRKLITAQQYKPFFTAVTVSLAPK